MNGLTLFKRFGIEAQQAGAFAPTDIAGLKIWLDASDASTITESGGAVSQWDDKSGNGNHVTQGTASLQPTTGTRTINSKNVLDFDGTGDILTNAGIGITGSQNRTFFVVGFSDINTGTGNLVSQGPSGGTFDQLGCTWEMANRVAGGNEVYDESMYSTAAIGVFGLDGTTVNGLFARKNGHELSVSSSASGLTTLDIGANFGVGDSVGDGTGDPLDGVIAEVLAYDSALSASDMEAVEQFLADKWGVTLV